MRRLRFDYDIQLAFDAPVREHAFVLRCVPPSVPGQEIVDVTLTLTPATAYTRQRDGFGNLLQIGRLTAPHDQFRYTVRGTALIDHARRVAEPCHPVFRYPSAYTTPDATLRAALPASLPAEPAARAWALVEAVQARMSYLPGQTGVATTAAEAWAAGRGVCQDFAHVWLALARPAGLAARYVNGLTEGEGASHAWCEVWLDGVWTGIDPTRACWTDEGYLRFGVGRDYGDCPLERGVFLGLTAQRQTVASHVREQ